MPSIFLPARPTGFESPSIAIEKGAYHLHAPHRPLSRSRSRPTVSKPDYILHRPSPSSASASARVSLRYERRMASLVVLLAIATTASFTAAWMLFITGDRGESFLAEHVDVLLTSSNVYITSDSLDQNLSNILGHSWTPTLCYRPPSAVSSVSHLDLLSNIYLGTFLHLDIFLSILIHLSEPIIRDRHIVRMLSAWNPKGSCIEVDDAAVLNADLWSVIDTIHAIPVNWPRTTLTSETSPWFKIASLRQRDPEFCVASCEPLLENGYDFKRTRFFTLLSPFLAFAVVSPACST
ncbi:hypothetical protein EW146_g6200 [Bondarzewia mesenterica]|uniref:Uncharacterized protein n=1 Tax=Bondarzewia mesenterica TaxID=1095465 RepID=A0A4S4LRD0_9AGAM|nr:hypothetical protein EW146_g6200 [Bondarzewia mesenterica]